MDIYNFIKTLKYLEKKHLPSFEPNTKEEYYQEYISKLNQVHIDLRGLRLSQVDTALYEVIYFFDKLSEAECDIHHQYDIPSGIDSIANLYNHRNQFRGDKIQKDILLAQFEYFTNKYLLMYFHKNVVPSHKGMPLTLRIKNNISYYLTHKQQVENSILQNNEILYYSLMKICKMKR